jgi:hypothetical protein
VMLLSLSIVKVAIVSLLAAVAVDDIHHSGSRGKQAGSTAAKELAVLLGCRLQGASVRAAWAIRAM